MGITERGFKVFSRIVELVSLAPLSPVPQDGELIMKMHVGVSPGPTDRCIASVPATLEADLKLILFPFGGRFLVDKKSPDFGPSASASSEAQVSPIPSLICNGNCTHRRRINISPHFLSRHFPYDQAQNSAQQFLAGGVDAERAKKQGKDEEELCRGNQNSCCVGAL